MEYNIREDVGINPLALDKEWIRQPRLLLQYSEALAKARSAQDRAKDNVDFVKADLDTIVREDMAARGGKVTEAAVLSNIATHPDMQAALAELNTARDDVNMLQAAVSAIETKKYALQNLVQLHTTGYYSELTAPAGAGKAVQEIREKAAASTELRLAERKMVRRG